MSQERVSAARWVQLLQASVARELVERMGVPVRRAAELMGIAPSAVSQYLSGKRREAETDSLEHNSEVVSVVRELALHLVESSATESPYVRPILEAAASMSEKVTGKETITFGELHKARPDRALGKQLRQRIAAEQASVSECMQLAQKARDELTRAIFRQIASDSLRHAEIVASIASYLDRGVNRTLASGITRPDVERLIARERVAEAQTSVYIQKHLGGVMSLLALSMKADERKHDELLNGLLRYGFQTGEGGASDPSENR